MVRALIQKLHRTTIQKWRARKWEKAHPHGVFHLKKKPKTLDTTNSRSKVYTYIRNTYAGISKEDISRKQLKRVVSQLLDGVESAGIDIKYTWFEIVDMKDPCANLRWVLPFAYLSFWIKPCPELKVPNELKDARHPLMVEVNLVYKKSSNYSVAHTHILKVYTFVLYPDHVRYTLGNGMNKIIAFRELDEKSSAYAWRDIFSEIEERAKRTYVKHRVKADSLFE